MSQIALIIGAWVALIAWVLWSAYRAVASATDMDAPTPPRDEVTF